MDGSSSTKGDYAEWMVNFANDDSHGYGWDSITEDWAVATGYPNATGTNRMGLIGNPDVICSTFVWLALKENGYTVSNTPFEVSNMADDLSNNGFSKVIFSEEQLQYGDIVVYEDSSSKASNHVEVYIGNGKFVGAREDTDQQQGDSNGNEVSVVDSMPIEFNYIWHAP